MKKRLISAALIICMLVSIVPVHAASDTDIVHFSMDLTSGGVTTTYNLLDGTPSIPFKKGDSYVFSIRFRDNEAVDKVYVAGEIPGEKVYLEAYYSDAKDIFLTSGSFGAVFMPLSIKVEYTKKKTDVFVTKDFEIENYNVPGIEDYTEEWGLHDRLEATMKVSKALKSSYDVCIKTIFDTYESDSGEEFSDWLGFIGDLDTLATYTAEGVNDEKYFLYLDYSKPSTYAMIFHDASDGSYTKFIVEAFVEDKPGALRTVSQKLDETVMISGLVNDWFAISNDTKDLREQVAQNDSLTQAEMEEAYERIERMHDDRIMFSVATTVLPALVTLGTVAGGAPALMFSAWLAYINASSDFFWDKRMGLIPGKSVSAGWSGSGYCGAVNKEDVSWELSGGVLTVSGSGEMKFSYPYDFYFPAVKKVVIEDGVTNAAFPALPNCTEVVLAESVTTLSTYAFQGFSSLTEIKLPRFLTTIGGLAFAKTALTSIEIPASVTKIGSRIFSQCSYLKEATFHTGSDLVSFSDGVYGNVVPFYECPSLETITFTGNMPTALIVSPGGSGKLLYLSGRPNIYYSYENETWRETTDAIDAAWKPGSNQHLVFIALGGPSGKCGDSVYWEMNREGDLTISGTGNMYDYYSSADPQWTFVKNLRSMTIEEGVTSIGREAFDDCAGIRSIEIADTVVTLGNDAFDGCTGLLNLHIPASLTSWHRGEPHGLEFSGCTSLRAITVDPDHPFLYSKDGVLYAKAGLYHDDGGVLMHCPKMKTGIHVIDDGTVELQGGCFSGCEGISQVFVPFSVREMGDYNHSVFGSCTGLRGIWYEGSESMWESIEKYGHEVVQPVKFLCSETTAEAIVKDSEGGYVHGAGEYLVGTEVILTAEPEEGMALHHWEDDRGNVLSEEPELCFIMERPMTVRAVFSELPEFENIELTGVYAFTHEADIYRDGDMLYITIAGEDASEAAAYAALYDDDGRMTGIIPLSADRADGVTCFYGRVISKNAVIFLISPDCAPMAAGIRAK